MLYISRLRKYMTGSSSALDLGTGLGPVVIDNREEYEVDYILCAYGWCNRQRFLVGSKGWDNNEAQ